jgi:hypothetical protein
LPFLFGHFLNMASVNPLQRRCRPAAAPLPPRCRAAADAVWSAPIWGSSVVAKLGDAACDPDGIGSAGSRGGWSFPINPKALIRGPCLGEEGRGWGAHRQLAAAAFTSAGPKVHAYFSGARS